MIATQDQPSEQAPTPHVGVPFVIPPDQLGQRWPVIERILQRAHGWTELVRIDEIHSQLMAGDMHAAGVLDHSNEMALALVRLTKNGADTHCVAFLMIPIRDSDGAALAALLRDIERFARGHGAVTLEINTAPWMAAKVEASMTNIRPVSVTLEKNLRARRELNS